MELTPCRRSSGQDAAAGHKEITAGTVLAGKPKPVLRAVAGAELLDA